MWNIFFKGNLIGNSLCPIRVLREKKKTKDRLVEEFE